MRVGKNQGSSEDEDSADPMSECEHITKIPDGEQERGKFSQRDNLLKKNIQ